MDERYWIIKDSEKILQDSILPHTKRLKLEIRHLQLRIELLKNEEELDTAVGVEIFNDLQQLVQEVAGGSKCERNYNKILEHLDTLLSMICHQRA